MMWEETLLDNLLNFAATPKGLLLLQQTGAINECVSHMFSRFTKKLQVTLQCSVLLLCVCVLPSYLCYAEKQASRLKKQNKLLEIKWQAR